MSEPDPAHAGEPTSHGPGRFVTLRIRRAAAGHHEVATSRRHRKGLRPHAVSDLAEIHRAPAARPEAFRRFWAPTRLAWWIALLFGIGSALFSFGGLAGAWPEALPSGVGEASVLNRVFVVGAVFFTTAAWLQWLEAINGDVAEAFEARPRWRWSGWRPRNLGYLSSAIQLVGTIAFNFNTIDATLVGPSWQREDLAVWLPDMLGCACFLAASYLAFAEVSHGVASFEPRSLSWWIAVVNLAGSVAFQIAALYALATPAPATPNSVFLAALYTGIGGLCFFTGSWLLAAEVFDEEGGGAVADSTDLDPGTARESA